MSSPVSAALKQCQDVQHMIDITSEHLDRLRSTFSNAGDSLTLQEIRTLEGKLIKQFSEQLAVKSGLGAQATDLVYFPSLSQWLKVVGVSSDTNSAILGRVRSLEELKDKTECELRRILLTAGRVPPNQRQEDLRRLCRSLLNLRKYTDALVYGNKVYGPSADPSKMELHWDSWQECSGPLPSPTRPEHLQGRHSHSITGSDCLSLSHVHSLTKVEGRSQDMGPPQPHSIIKQPHENERLTERAHSRHSSGSSGQSVVTDPFCIRHAELSRIPTSSTIDPDLLYRSARLVGSNEETSHHRTGRHVSSEEHHLLRSLPSRDKLFGTGVRQGSNSSSASHSESLTSSLTSYNNPNSPGYSLSPPVSSGPHLITPPATPPWLLLSQQGKDRHGSPVPKSNLGIGSPASKSGSGSNNSSGLASPATRSSGNNSLAIKSHPSSLGTPPKPLQAQPNTGVCSFNSSSSVKSQNVVNSLPTLGKTHHNSSTSSGGNAVSVGKPLAASVNSSPASVKMLATSGTGMASSSNKSGQNSSVSTSATPPASKKHSTGLTREFSLSKSKSHESELGQKTDSEIGQESRLDTSERVDSSGYSSSSEATGPHQGRGRKRLHSSEPDSSSSGGGVEGPGGGTAYSGHSPINSPKSPSTQQLVVPRSPHAHNMLPGSRAMHHMIQHRFAKTFKPARCDFCQEYFFQGLKCKECKFRVHTQCENQVPPSCGLPRELLDLYFSHLTHTGPGPGPVREGGGGSPGLARHHHLPSHHHPPFDSSSSSCNSSTPSSPQVIVSSHLEVTPPWLSGGRGRPFPSASSQTQPTSHHFQFPEPGQVAVSPPQVAPLAPAVGAPSPGPSLTSSTASGNQTPAPRSAGPSLLLERVVSPNPLVDTVRSNDSDKTLSGSSDSIGTAYRLDSQDSTTSVEGDACSTWSSGRQMSIREWDIPYEELKIGDKIGSGRFSTVHQGNWHGDVAIKFLDMDNIEDETQSLEAFRLDVATFRKTRHENLVLFMGACMKPPHLAIITSLCKGNTLYTHLHLRRDKFFMNKVIIIAQQIATGMGYLHHKGIIHKDLKTKNIFLENGRAIITDFGLVNVARRLCSRHKRPAIRGMKQDCMSIPAGWLCYLAPEVICELKVQEDGSNGEDLPFTRASDIYAFGTVWYELLTGEWPWKRQPPEAIIWQVGKGIKPTLANLQASREVKDVLMQCWLYNSRDRPDFQGIAKTLEKLPKKRLARSPSHPVHLSRSAEALF